MDMNELETETQHKIKLPKGFLLGAATSAHQVEGNNMNSDWWQYEKSGRLPASGEACDHYNRYDEDFKIAQKIGLNSFRISIEWARIEPAENQWDKVAIEHYKKVLKDMKDNGLVRMVTLFHFTLPQWAADKGGFENKDVIQAFARYAWFLAQNLGDEIDLWCTINEPEVYSIMGYGRGHWPPFKKNWWKFLKVFQNLARAHNSAALAIKQVLPSAKVGLAKNNTYYEPHSKHGLLDRVACGLANYFGNIYFLNKTRKNSDWIGLNYYFTRTLKFSWRKRFEVMNNPARPKSDMGWQTFPEGIYHLLIDLKRYNLPIYITENGIANARDDMRQDFIRQHLNWALKAKNEGANVQGYFYWSLIDNYEWDKGFDPKFGLVEIDYATQKRTIRPSAEILKEIVYE